MPLRPDDWSVVCVGNWNPALFTPHLIATRVFKLADTQPVEVFVSIDEVLPAKVSYGGLTVSATTNRFVVELADPSFDLLQQAMQVAARILNDLSRTPVKAVGLNLRYRDDSLPESLIRRFADDLDRRLADISTRVIGRGFNRVVQDGEGRLLLKVSAVDGERSEVLINFECRTDDIEKMAKWLECPVGDIRSRVVAVLNDVLGLAGGDYVLEQSN
jgi:hypothetical protein